jgi:hypothetical protein
MTKERACRSIKNRLEDFLVPHDSTSIRAAGLSELIA